MTLSPAPSYSSASVTSPPPKPEGPRAELAAIARLIAKARDGMRQELILIDQRMALAMWELRGANRNASQSKIKRYYVAMEENRWKLTHQGLMFDTNGQLRDGQHRIAALIKHGKPLQFWVCFGCDPKAFNVVDQGDKRTAANLLSIDQIPNASLTSATVAFLLRIERKDVFYDANAVVVTTRAKLAENDNLAAGIHAAMRLRKVRTARPSAMAAAYYWILQRTKSPDRLPLFWENLITGADLSMRDARLPLREILLHPEVMLPPLRGGASSYGLGMRQAGALVLAWNNWVRGKPIARKALEWRRSFDLPEEVL